MPRYTSPLPEGCISNIMSFTSPIDACTSTLVSSTFKSAADSDVVWQKFFPPDYKYIVARSVPLLDLNGFGSNKELYFRLCDEPILIEGGTKCFSLEKKTGKKCFMIGARELNIAWADVSQYWAWISLAESRFAEVAQLLYVRSLHITGTIDTQMLSPKTMYAVYLVIKFTEDAYGLHHPPAKLSVNFTGREGSTNGSRTAYLDPECNRRQQMRSPRNPYHYEQWCQRFGHMLMTRGEYPRQRRDGWLEIEMGEFYNEDGEDGMVEATLDGTQGSHWKGGLVVQGIAVRPKGSVD